MTGGVGAGGSVILPDRAGPVAQFWEGIQQGRLLLQRCKSCGHRWHPMADICERCLSTETEWCDSQGAGTLFSYTVVHHAVHPAVAAWIPYTLILVQLDEGPRILSTLSPDQAGPVVIGSRMKLGFKRLSAQFQIPVFSFTPVA